MPASRRSMQDSTEEADYVSFWIDIGEYNNPAAIASGEKFLQKHPGSAEPRRSCSSSRGSTSGTDRSQQRRRISNASPSTTRAPPRAEIALFSAGRAAMRIGTAASIESAINIFTRVAEMGGQFATAAKLQHAIVRRTQLGEEEAIPIPSESSKENRPASSCSRRSSPRANRSPSSAATTRRSSPRDRRLRLRRQHPEVTTFWLTPRA